MKRGHVERILLLPIGEVLKEAEQFKEELKAFHINPKTLISTIIWEWFLLKRLQAQLPFTKTASVGPLEVAEELYPLLLMPEDVLVRKDQVAHVKTIIAAVSCQSLSMLFDVAHGLGLDLNGMSLHAIAYQGAVLTLRFR